MSYDLRLCRLSDAPGVVETVHHVYDEYGLTWEAEGYHADLYDLSPFLDASYGRFWVAEQEGTIIGCGGITFFERVPGETGVTTHYEGLVRIGGCDCEITRMYVQTRARGMGIASAIMRNILAEAANRHALEIWSDKRFDNAHRLYQKFGASIVSERICEDPDLSPEWGLWIRGKPEV